MIEMDTKLIRLGHSFGAIIPLNKIENTSLKEGSKIHLMIIPQENQSNLRWLWGSCKSKSKKSTAQRMKEIDEELYDD